MSRLPGTGSSSGLKNGRRRVKAKKTIELIVLIFIHFFYYRVKKKWVDNPLTFTELNQILCTYYKSANISVR